MKKFFKAVYDFITDANGDGDIAKLGGLALMVISIVRFAVTGSFDALAFGAGAAAAVASKAIDIKLPKTGA
jgi:hypothetical protein